MMIAFDKIPQFAINGTLLALDDYASEEYLDPCIRPCGRASTLMASSMPRPVT